MKKIFIFIFCIFAFSTNALEKTTTFNKELFDKAQSDGKVVVVNSLLKGFKNIALEKFEEG